MNEPGMSIFHRIYYSITSFQKYRYFLRQSTGKAVGYLLVITLVIAIFTFIPAINEYNNKIDELTNNFDSLIPEFKLSGGKLEVYGDMPIVMDGGGLPVVVDTSPDAESRILNSYDTVILITGDGIIQKNYIDKRKTSFAIWQGLELTRDTIKQSLPIVKPIGIFIFSLAGLFFIGGKFISALLVSLAGTIINSVKKTGLSYRSIFKISVYSLTGPLLVSSLLSFLLPVQIPYLWLLYYTAALIYVGGAINVIKKELESSTF